MVLSVRKRSQMDTVLFAGFSAVQVRVAGRQKSAEDAMICVEYRQMLIQNHFQTACQISRVFNRS